MSDAVKEVDGRARPVSGFAGILPFACKTLIVVGALSFSAIFVAAWAVDYVQGAVSDIHIGGTQFWEKVEAELDRAASASSDLPAAKKQKLIRDVQIIAARWRPFLNAALNEPPRPANANDEARSEGVSR